MPVEKSAALAGGSALATIAFALPLTIAIVIIFLIVPASAPRSCSTSGATLIGGIYIGGIYRRRDRRSESSAERAPRTTRLALGASKGGGNAPDAS